MSFASLKLMPELLRAVSDEGYTDPTPIQAKAIPVILERRDLMGCAQTGTGKTAGFTLPLLQILAPQANTSPSPARHPVRALILAPTRELAAQVAESVRVYGKHLALRSTMVYGGIDIAPQKKALHGGVEILIATPGRLLDHLEQKTVNLSRVEILVLDEADRMLDMGFLPDIKRILAVLPKERQSLLFSATFSEEIRRLGKELLRHPTMVDVAPRNAPADLVTHEVYEIPATRKRALLAHLVRSRDIKQALVFVRMKRDANRLARELVRDGINATAIHSDRSQAEREQALADFKENRATVLVATDIAARGLDIEQLPYVVNYELPHTPEDYVHRIGRTGRAGMQGDAISLVCADEAKLLAAIEKLLNRPLRKLPLPSDFAEDSHRRSRDADAHPVRETHRRSGERDEHPARTPRTRSTERDDRPQRSTTRRGERDEHQRGTQRGERDEHPRGTQRGESDEHPRGTQRGESDERPRSTQRGEREEHSRSTQRGEREEHPRSTQRGERRDHRTSTSSGHRSKPAAASDFDFTKPYEPAAASEAKPAPDAPAVPYRGRQKRPTPALLGGSPGAHKSHK
jgi:ATP-dependent RNA helicase RhlE